MVKEITDVDLTIQEASTVMGSDLVVPQSSTKPLTTPTVPINDHSSADVPEVCIDFEVNINSLINDHITVVSSDGDKYKLPSRSNRGKPLERYSFDNSKMVKYPIVHYVSTKQLPCAIQAFVNQIQLSPFPREYKKRSIILNRQNP
ncbi:hypothetical protein ACOSQ4_009633 [Xanthoceras sorbifolium]